MIDKLQIPEGWKIVLTVITFPLAIQNALFALCFAGDNVWFLILKILVCKHTSV